MLFTSGIYQMDSVTIPVGETWEAAGRVIITRSDGKPPSVYISSGATVRGIWFGGTRETSGGAVVNIAQDAVFENCALFGYYGGFVIGDTTNGHRAQIINSMFVNCGSGDYVHPIYLADWTGQPGDGMTIDGNLFLGCEGYSIHLWNDNYGGTHYHTVTRNFIGAAHKGIVSKGHDNLINRNVIWSTDSTHSYLSIGAGLKWTWNLYGAQVGQLLNQSDSDAVIRNNGFIAPTPTFGKSPQVYDNVRGLLGYSQASITNSVTALVAAFTQTPQALLIDTSIDTHRDKLRDVLAHWSVAA